jgi:hypothetical protein
MQSFCEGLVKKTPESAGHVVVASFFFDASVPGQNQPKTLVTTLAHQIAERSPTFRSKIVTVIRYNLAIFSTSLEHQIEYLLLKPLSELHAYGTSPNHSLTFISAVDGLDECDGDGAQSRVIHLLHSLSKVPNVRIVLASRPEFSIQSAIRRQMPGMLHVDLNKMYGAATDIHRFTWARLLEIRDSRPSLLGIDPLSWPSEGDAEKIAECASGQFILADTALRYVDDRRYDPRERLKEVLALCEPQRERDSDEVVPARPSSMSVQPLGTLDGLFSGILDKAARNVYPDRQDHNAGQAELASLVWILTKTLSTHAIPLWVVEEALGLSRGDITHQLSDLHSLLDIPQDVYTCMGIGVHHKSFLDFLEDPRRSGHLGNTPLRAEHRLGQMVKTYLREMNGNGGLSRRSQILA